MNTIAISNYKGGVGKTTTAVNLATLFAKNGKRVLLIDLDPQASATDYFGLYGEAESTGRNSISLLYGNAPVEKVTHETKIPNLSMVPSLIDLIDQNELMLREQRLKFALDDASGDYDIAIVDCSPVMKRLAFNAYLAATDDGLVIVPVKLDGSVMRGTALTVNATRAIADALRMPTPRFKILRTCVPGRATRSEFWFAVLFNFLAGFVAAFIPFIGWLYPLAVLVPNLAIAWRRLHDIGKSGTYLLMGLIPLAGPIILIVYYCTDSVGDNEYGRRIV